MCGFFFHFSRSLLFCLVRHLLPFRVTIRLVVVVGVGNILQFVPFRPLSIQFNPIIIIMKTKANDILLWNYRLMSNCSVDSTRKSKAKNTEKKPTNRCGIIYEITDTILTLLGNVKSGCACDQHQQWVRGRQSFCIVQIEEDLFRTTNGPLSSTHYFVVSLAISILIYFLVPALSDEQWAAHTNFEYIYIRVFFFFF